MVCFKHDAVKLLFQNHPKNQAKVVSKDGYPLEINSSAWKREGEVFRKKRDLKDRRGRGFSSEQPIIRGFRSDGYRAMERQVLLQLFCKFVSGLIFVELRQLMV